jgi:hypothetical protein
MIVTKELLPEPFGPANIRSRLGWIILGYKPVVQL